MATDSALIPANTVFLLTKPTITVKVFPYVVTTELLGVVWRKCLSRCDFHFDCYFLAGPTLDQEAKSKLSATFNSMEYSEAEVPNIIPKGTEKVQRRSLVLEEEAAAGALSAGGVPIPRSRSRATNASAAR